MKQIISFILALPFLYLAACSDSSSPDPDSGEPSGKISLSVSLQPALDTGREVTSGTVVFIGDDETEYHGEMFIDSVSAYASATRLEPGDYRTHIKLYTGVPVLARGFRTLTAETGNPPPITVDFMDWDTPFPWLPRNILFVGNSLTYYNGGLDAHIDAFVEDADLGFDFAADKETRGGYSLQMHYENNYYRIIEKILHDDHDAVVFQGSPSTMVNDPEMFSTYARLWKDAIAPIDLEILFLVPPSYEYAAEYADSIASVCNAVCEELWATPLPVNQVWYSVLDQNPSAGLYDPDGVHPSLKGTVLYTYVVFSLLFKQSPAGIPYDFDYALEPSERLQYQTIAWETVREQMGWDR